MWPLVRCTVSRAAPTWRILRRVCRARRRRAMFLSLMAGRLLLLGLFKHDHLVDITHALALVRLGRAVGAHFGGHLPDELLVDAGDDDLGLGGGSHLHALRHLV